MTDAHYDRAPGDTSTFTQTQSRALSGLLIYTIGLFLAVLLTATSFWAANTSLLVLDSNMQLAPIGATAELYVGGEGFDCALALGKYFQDL